MTIIKQDDLIESVAAALQYISYYHPADYIQHLARAYESEQSPAAKDAIAQILTNSRMCAEGKRPICQDTGMVNVFLKIGMGVRRCEMFVPAARLGLHFYRGGMERYVNRLGLSMAKRVLLACETLDAQAMRDSGFLDQLLDDEDGLDAATQALCERLCGYAPLALSGMKKHLNAIANGRLDLHALRADLEMSNASEDQAEGLRAWQEKRAPRFQGR